MHLVDGWHKAGFADIEPTADLYSIYYRQSDDILYSGITHTVPIEAQQLFLYINHNLNLFNPNVLPDNFTFKPAQDTD